MHVRESSRLAGGLRVEPAPASRLVVVRTFGPFPRVVRASCPCLEQRPIPLARRIFFAAGFDPVPRYVSTPRVGASEWKGAMEEIQPLSTGVGRWSGVLRLPLCRRPGVQDEHFKSQFQRWEGKAPSEPFLRRLVTWRKSPSQDHPADGPGSQQYFCTDWMTRTPPSDRASWTSVAPEILVRSARGALPGD